LAEGRDGNVEDYSHTAQAPQSPEPAAEPISFPATFPYVQFETYNLRNRQDVQDMRDVQTILRQYQEFDEITQHLNKSALDGFTDDFKQDLEWRSDLLGLELDFWQLASVDFPRQLEVGRLWHFDPLAVRQSNPRVDKQAFAAFPYYKNVQIVRQSFRCFHRADGK
jgi:hypothetical protein